MGFLNSWQPRLLSVLRIVAGLAFLEHGLVKFFHFPISMGSGPLPPLMQAAGALELVGGALLVLGLFTQPVAFVLSGEMAVAYWMFHAPSGPYPIANMGEPALLYCFTFLYLASAGGGSIGLDAILGRKRGLEA